MPNPAENTSLSAEDTPTRPVVRYHGGKWRLAPWIISHFPRHRSYCEPFGGAGSVLMRKPRARWEVYNDLDGDVVNLFRVLRDKDLAAELRRLCELTPFSRDEFEASYQNTEGAVEKARRFVVCKAMGYSPGGASATRTGFRSNSARSGGSTGVQDWVSWGASISSYTARLRGVVIENRPAAKIIEQQDRTETLFYVDPPYPHSTRSSISHGSGGALYKHEATDEDHINLSRVLRHSKGMVFLSSYESDLYDDLYRGWERVTKETLADQGAKRLEVLWMNSAAAAASRGDLFSSLGREKSNGAG